MPTEKNAKKSLTDRFWAKVDRRGQDDCWLWAASRRKGYGTMWVNGQMAKAHRLSWELHNGPIPEGDGYHGTCVLHRCDVRSCVNPAHLFLGTNADNIADCVNKGRQSRGDKHGAAFRGEKNGRAKLTEKKVLRIRVLYAQGGMTQERLGKLFHVGRATIGYIVQRETWTHI